MIHKNSKKTYLEIKEDAVRQLRRQEVMNIVRMVPLMTSREYATIFLKYRDMNMIRPRITELKNEGKIIEVGKRMCSISHRTCMVFRVRENG